MCMMCVCMLYLHKLYIYNISPQLARKPNEYHALAAQGAARPEETILPPILICYFW